MYTTLGALTFQQMFDTTDEETVERLAFDMKWHFALDLDGESDSDKYLSPRTLWTMRTLLSEKELDMLLFDQVTGKLARVFSVDTKNQRLDSVHLFSNMRHLGRIGIFVRVITKFLVNLKRHHPDLFESLPRSFAERYLTRKGRGVFSTVKPSQTDRTLEALGFDLFDLVRRFAGNDDVCAMSSYKQMSRVLCEQCTVISGENKDAVTVKPPGEVSSGSLQNPAEPDATYCGHKGQGYQAHVMETYVPAAGDDGEKAPGPSLITHVSVEQAHESDANALVPAITDAADRGLAPVELLADAAYGSEKNVAGAKALGLVEQ